MYTATYMLPLVLCMLHAQHFELGCTRQPTRNFQEERSANTEASLVNTPLANHIEVMVAEIYQLKKQLQQVTAHQYFRIEHVQHDDALVMFYTGFSSSMVFLAFFAFLCPAVNELNYWSAKDCQHCKNRRLELSPKNQLLLLLVRL